MPTANPNVKQSRTEIEQAKRKAGLLPFIAAGLDVSSNKTSCKCPFHDDRTPSAGVYQNNGFWKFHCFPCDIDDDAISFIARTNDISNDEATMLFMKEYGPLKKPASKSGNGEGPLEPYSVQEYALFKVDLPEEDLRQQWEVEDGIHTTKSGKKIPCVIYPWSPGVNQKRFANDRKLLDAKGAGLYGAEQWRFEEFGEDIDYCIVTEGSSNAQTLSFVSAQPVLGSPSCNWKKEFASHPFLHKSNVIYAIQDPPPLDQDGKRDADPTKKDTGLHFVRAVADSLPSKRVYAVRFWKFDEEGVYRGAKDAVELWMTLAEFTCSTRDYESNPHSERTVQSYEIRRELFHEALYEATQKAELVQPQKPVEWGEPRDLTPNELPPVMPFKLEYLPESLRPMAEDVAIRLNVPLDFTGVYAIAGLAGATGQRALVHPKQRDPFVKPLNLWGGLIDDSGAKKTPVYKLFTRPHNEVDEKWYAEWLKRHKAWETKQEERSIDPLNEEPDEEDDPEPQPHNLLINWSTAAKFHELTTRNPSGIFTAYDELAGWLADLEAPYQTGARAFFMTCWSGGPYKWSTIQRGEIRSNNSLMSIFGNFVPAKLATFVSENREQEDGLIQRFQVLVQPDRRPFKATDMPEDVHARERYEAIIKRLAALDFESVELRFDPAAQPMYAEWEAEVDSRQEKEVIRAKRSHLSKYPAFMATLAALLQLADYHAENEKPSARVMLIDIAHTKQAIDLCRYFLSHLDRIYGGLPQPWHSVVGLLADRLRRGDLNDTFTVRDIHRPEWTGLKNMDLVREALRFLEKRDWIRPTLEKPNPNGGRPSEKYLVNPKVWKPASEE